MKYFIPNISDIALITEDVEIAITFSRLFNKPKTYLPIFEPPRVTRPDAHEEATQIKNAIARGKIKKIVYGKLVKAEIDLLDSLLPGKMVQKIDDVDQLYALSSKRPTASFAPLSPYRHIGINLLKNLHIKKCPISDASKVQRDDFYEGNSGLLIVAEEKSDITSIIIANYSVAFDASLLFINSIPKEEVEKINDCFFNLYSNNTSIQDELEKIQYRLKSYLTKIQLDKYFCATYFTSGAPLGFATQEIPTTHIFNYPLLGINLCNYIGKETFNNIIKVSVLIEPGSFENSEIPIVRKVLLKKRSIIRLLKEKEASVVNAHLFFAAYPFDFLLISSHSDEVKGERCTYQYLDSEGIERKLVVDEGRGMGWDQVKKKFFLTTFSRFVELDGISWTDQEAKEKLYVGKAIIDFSKIQEEDTFEYKIIHREKIDKVHSAMAYQMNDGVFLPMIHSLADENCPIIFSNACSSWRKVSFDLMFGGARLYLGPIIDVTNIEAMELMDKIFTKHINRPLCFALWRSQREMYGDQIRKPYLIAGTHFTKFSFSNEDHSNHLLATLNKSSIARFKRASTAKEKDIIENSERFGVFLKEELKAFLRSRQNS